MSVNKDDKTGVITMARKHQSPQYFVLARSLWQGDTWSAIAGGLSKADAEKVAAEKAHNGWSEPVWDEMRKAWWAGTQDLKRVVNTRVVSKTKMVREYKISLDMAYESIAYVEDAEKIDWTI